MNKCFSIWCKSHNLNDKNVSNICFMAILVRVMKIHIGNVINRPPRQNAPMFRVLTSFILRELNRVSENICLQKFPVWCTRVYWHLKVYMHHSKELSFYHYNNADIFSQYCFVHIIFRPLHTTGCFHVIQL